jgi:hypothetical protein
MSSLPNDAAQVNIYDDLAQTNVYTLRPGVCILPLAEDPPPAGDPALATYSPVVELRLHAPYRIRRQVFAADKQRNPPVLPTPQSAGAFKFLGGSISFTTQSNATFWDSDWQCAGEYVFVETCVSRPEDGFVLGSSMPFTQNQDYANIAAYGTHPVPSPGSLTAIGAIAQAGPNAVSGYNYARTYMVSQDATLNLPVNWSYTSPAYYPGILFNDQLANGGGTDGGQVTVSVGLLQGQDGT